MALTLFASLIPYELLLVGPLFVFLPSWRQQDKVREIPPGKGTFQAPGIPLQD